MTLNKLFLGPEVGLKKDAISKLTSQLKKKCGDDTEVYRYYPTDLDLPDLMSQLYNGSLFAPHRIFIINGIEQIKKKKELDLLKAYIKKPAEETTLILTSDSASIDKSLDKLFDKQDKQIFWEMFENDKRGWIIQFFRSRDLTIEKHAIGALLDIVENNTDELKKGCETLSYYFKKGSSISEEDVEKYVYHSKEENGFTLFEHYITGDISAALESYQKLKGSGGSDATQVFSIFYRQLEQLLRFLKLRDDGLAPDQCYRKLFIMGKTRQKRVAESLRKHNVDNLNSYLKVLSKREKESRMVRRELQPLLFEMFILETIGAKN